TNHSMNIVERAKVPLVPISVPLFFCYLMLAQCSVSEFKPLIHEGLATILVAGCFMSSVSKTAPNKKSSPPPPRTEVPSDAAVQFDWPLANDAEAFLRQRTGAFLERNTAARQLAERMRTDTGTDFFEWIDHLVLPADAEKGLREAGFVIDDSVETPNGESVFEHPRATLPRVLVGARQCPSVIALRPEFVADFVARHNLSAAPEGEPFSRYRRIFVTEEDGTRLDA